MWRCLKCGGEVADTLENCWVCGTSREGAPGAGLPPSGPPVVATVVRKPRRPPRPQVGMPRRFSIGTAMILTAVFAVVLSILKTFDAPPLVFGVISLFVVAIAVCQAVLFKGKNPRKASILVGFVTGVLLFAAVAFSMFWYERGYRHVVSMEDLAYLFLFGVADVLVCTAFGYVVGWFIAAVFLVRKEPDNAPPAVGSRDQSAVHRVADEDRGP